jgi:outer membrane protein assembly factor BamE (lipoprotein component of BamABCDE complex)
MVRSSFGGLSKLMFAVVTVAILAGGCTSTKYRHGMPIRDTDVQQIVKGKTTMNDIISMFGEPTRTTPMGDEVLFTYVHSVTTARTVHIPYGASGEGATEEDKLTVTFDKDKLVKAFSIRRGIATNK